MARVAWRGGIQTQAAVSDRTHMSPRVDAFAGIANPFGLTSPIGNIQRMNWGTQGPLLTSLLLGKKCPKIHADRAAGSTKNVKSR
jgi:hypothetical protein